YTGSFANEPFMYAAIRKAYRLLEISGVLAKLDIFAFTALNEADSLMNWIVGGPSATNGGMPFSVGQGFSGNGSASIRLGSSYANMEKFSQDSGHVGVYLSSNPGPDNATNVALGTYGGAQNVVIYPRSSASGSGYRVSGASTKTFSNPRHGETGFLLANR